MENDIYLIGEVGYDITLDTVINQVKQSDSNKPLQVYIHSEGGSVYDAVAIYNYLKNLPQEVNTNAIGLVASAASIFFLAGKNRTAYIQNRILIHLPMNIGIGNAKDLEDAAADLREEEQKIAQIYVDETNFTLEEALEQMREDKMFTTQQLLDKGFITKLIDFKAVANLNNKPKNKKDNKKHNKMSKEYSKEEKGAIAKFLEGLGFGKKEEPKNIIIKTASQEDLDFYELEEGEPKIGDKAKLNDEDATGEIVLSDGRTFVFGDEGSLKEIKEKQTDDENDDLENKIKELEKENERLNELNNSKVDKTELEAKKSELATLQNTHDELVNKLKSFSSKFSVDTLNENPKPTNKKETFAERMQRLENE